MLRAEKLSLSLDGVPLNCVRFGTGEKNLVMLPGLSLRDVNSAAHSLAFLYRDFAKLYTVYVLDKKSLIPDSCTIRGLARDAAQAVEQLGIGPADVFGVSQGGMIALELAAEFPQLVRKLALGVTAARSNPVLCAVLQNWISLAENNRFDELFSDMIEKLYSDRLVRKYKLLVPLLAKAAKPKDSKRFTALAKSCLTCCAFPVLHKISCPAFVIGGKLDAVVTAEASVEIARELGCELFLYPDLGHAAYEEAPDFNARILRFLTADP
ncbi:MAG: alpha/beta hydrolase [Oscillospiraceae bacterium]|nr:alpha/beta hydrolase [Oscillospiraceae bacterium]